MKPIPTEEDVKDNSRQIPGIPLNPSLATYSTANRRLPNCSVQMVYPWLLFASTAIAATFCLAYITKPVILADPSPTSASPVLKDVATSGQPGSSLAQKKILPNPNRLPGDKGRPSPENAVGKPPAASQKSDFEVTWTGTNVWLPKMKDYAYFKDRFYVIEDQTQHVDQKGDLASRKGNKAASSSAEVQVQGCLFFTNKYY